MTGLDLQQSIYYSISAKGGKMKEGNNIALFREQLCMSREDLAKGLGVSAKTLMEWENDIEAMTEKEVSDVALALGTDSGALRRRIFPTAQVPIHDSLLGAQHNDISGFLGYLVLSPETTGEESGFPVTSCRMGPCVDVLEEQQTFGDSLSGEQDKNMMITCQQPNLTFQLFYTCFIRESFPFSLRILNQTRSADWAFWQKRTRIVQKPLSSTTRHSPLSFQTEVL